MNNKVMNVPSSNIDFDNEHSSCACFALFIQYNLTRSLFDFLYFCFSIHALLEGV
jgi:hypothetical protein